MIQSLIFKNLCRFFQGSEAFRTLGRIDKNYAIDFIYQVFRLLFFDSIASKINNVEIIVLIFELSQLKKAIEGPKENTYHAFDDFRRSIIPGNVEIM